MLMTFSAFAHYAQSDVLYIENVPPLITPQLNRKQQINACGITKAVWLFLKGQNRKHIRRGNCSCYLMGYFNVHLMKKSDFLIYFFVKQNRILIYTP